MGTNRLFSKDFRRIGAVTLLLRITAIAVQIESERKRAALADRDDDP